MSCCYDFSVSCNLVDQSIFYCLSYSKPDLTESAKQGLNKLLATEVPIEMKPVSPAHFYRFAPGEPRRLFWARARGYIGTMPPEMPTQNQNQQSRSYTIEAELSDADPFVRVQVKVT